jgi:hypothetical protein
MPGDQRPIRKLGLGDHPWSGPLNLALIHNRRRRQRFDHGGAFLCINILTREQRVCGLFAFWTNSVRGMFVDKRFLGSPSLGLLYFEPTVGMQAARLQETIEWLAAR